VRRLELALNKLRAERFQTGDDTFTVTFSAGVAEFPTDGTDWTTLYRMADDSLTRAKTLGRNQVIGGATREAPEPVTPRSAVPRDLGRTPIEPPRAR
jgi:predicted signal transduction protein with EAL and GGDEF domain